MKEHFRRFFFLQRMVNHVYIGPTESELTLYFHSHTFTVD